MNLKRIGMIALAFAMVSVLALATAPSVANAQTRCPKTSSVNMANLESSVASIVITAYNPDGSENGSPFDDTISANGSKVYFPIPNIEAGFSGSLVVSSDRDVAAIANIVCSDLSAGGSYNAGTGGSTSVSLPLLFKDNSGFYTQFSVQNAGSSDATVNVAYSDGTSVGPTVIKPGAAAVYDQANENHTQAIFGAVVTSNGEPILAAALQEDPSIIFAYTGATGAGVTNPVFPLVNANNSGYITGIQIQNTGGQATDVTVTYTPSAAGTSCTETQTVAAGASNTFALAAFSGSPGPGITTNCANGVRFIGSAEVTANSTGQALFGLVNQLLPGVNGEAYGAFSKADATNTVVMPLIMDRNSNYFTGINVQNVGTGTTTVECSFTDTNYSISQSLGAGEALTDIQNNKIADGYIGAGTCTTTDSGGKIVATVNQLNQVAAGDQLLVYEGINR